MQRCLMAGERETGIAIQKIVRQLDAGDVITSSKISIPPDMTCGELEAALCELTKPLLLQVLAAYDQGIPPASPQNHDQATYAPKIELEEGELDWTLPAETLHNKIRAFSPRPGAWCWQEKGKKRIKILRSRLIDRQGHPGQLLAKEGIVACGTQALELVEVQPEGKPRMRGSDWLRGLPSEAIASSFQIFPL